jgi:quercetin dioxygenase-like cupin family protein
MADAAAEIVISNIRDVTEVPIHGYTNDSDSGMTRELVSHRVNGSPDLCVFRFRMGPHAYHPLHLHPNVGELYYILEGSCELRVGDRTELVTAGTAIYTPVGIPHSARTFDEGVAILIVFPEGDWDKVQKEFVAESDA